MIAMALSCRPALLIADEPTTALDVTVQAQLLELIKALQREIGMAMLFITHNLGVAAEIADRIAVMYAGRVVEEAPSERDLRHPRMPYTARAARPPSRGWCWTTARCASPPSRARCRARRTIHAGCAFHPRCAACRCPASAMRPCPRWSRAARHHAVRCVRWRALAAEAAA